MANNYLVSMDVVDPETGKTTTYIQNNNRTWYVNFLYNSSKELIIVTSCKYKAKVSRKQMQAVIKSIKDSFIVQD